MAGGCSCLGGGAKGDHDSTMHQQQGQPAQAEPGQVAPGMAQLLHHPQTAVDGGIQGPVQGEVHDSIEVAIQGIFGVGGSVPADRHRNRSEGWVGRCV